MAMRLAKSRVFYYMATASVVAPRLASLHAVANVNEMERLSRNSASAMTLLSLPILLAVVLAPHWILGLAGPDFEAGAGALVILTFGQFVIVATGPSGFLLSMTGRQSILRNVNVLGALLNLILNAVLIPLLGVIGAATATATSLALINLALVLEAKRQVRVNVLTILVDWVANQVADI